MKIEKVKLIECHMREGKPLVSAVFRVYKPNGDYYYSIGIFRVDLLMNDPSAEFYNGQWKKTKDGFVLVVD